MKKKHSWFGWVLVIVGLAVACGGLGAPSGSPTRVGGSQQAVGSAAKVSEEVFGPGDTVELNGVSITFHGVNETMGTDFWQPETNKIFAIAEFTVENNSAENINISSVFGSDAYCDGYLVSESMSAELGDRQGRENLTGSVAPGRKLRGIIGYELPSQWQQLEIRLKTDWWKGSRAGTIVFVAKAV